MTGTTPDPSPDETFRGGVPVPLAPSEIDANAPIVYTNAYDGKTHVRASALGSCPRALYYAFMGKDPAPPPEKMQAIFDQGHEIEAKVITMLEALGWRIVDAQPRFVHESSLALEDEANGISRICIVGHGDLMAVSPDGKACIVEIKGLGSALMTQLKSTGFFSLLGYGRQLSFYGHMAPKTYPATTHAVSVVYEKETGDLHYEWFKLPTDLLPLSTVIDPIRTALAALPDPPDCTLQYPCPYFKLHEDFTDTLPTEYVAMGKMYLALAERVGHLKSAQDKIKEKLLVLDQGSYKAPGYSVSISPKNIRTDMERIKQLLKEADVDIADFQSRPDGLQIRITPKKGS